VSDLVKVEKQVLVQNERGLHARAATQFVQLAAKYPCDVQIAKDTTEVNGKSIMGVLMLVATKGTTLTIKARGDKAAECVDALVALVNDKFGEVK
jgi:phosphocarrier protein HPr